MPAAATATTTFLEPILLHLAADKNKERHDALTRLKTILDDKTKVEGISVDLATRLVRTFVKMLRLDWKCWMMAGPHATSYETNGSLLTSAQSNKIMQQAKDLRWLLGILEHQHIMQALPDLYNFYLDALESDERGLCHAELLHGLRMHIFLQKHYLLDMRPEQWDRFLSYFLALFQTTRHQPSLSWAVREEVICCVFFLALAIHEGSSWMEKAVNLAELLLEITLNVQAKSSESPAMAILFRTINYLLNELKNRSTYVYDEQLNQFHRIMKGFSGFKTPLVIEEFYLFFLSGQVPPLPELQLIGSAELMKSRLKPSDLDPIKLGECIAAYLKRDQSFNFPKGYLPFIVGLDFIHHYSPPALNLEELFRSPILLVEKFASTLFAIYASQTEMILERLLSYFDTSAGPKKIWAASLLNASFLIKTNNRAEDFIKKVFKVMIGYLQKGSQAELCSTILTSVLSITGRLPSDSINFCLLVDYLRPCLFTESSLKLLHVYFLLWSDGIKWSFNVIDAHAYFCSSIVHCFDMAKDPRIFLEPFLNNTYLIAKILAVPFSNDSDVHPTRVIQNGPSFEENSSLLLLPPSSISTDYQRFRAIQDENITCHQQESYSKNITKLLQELSEQFQSIGFQPCKLVLANLYQANVKEDNFNLAMIQMVKFYVCLLTDFKVDSIKPLALMLSELDLCILGGVVERRSEQNPISLFCVKFLINSFEYYNFRVKQDLETAKNSNISQFWHLKPLSFMRHTHIKNNIAPYRFLRIFSSLYSKLTLTTLPASDLEAKAFIEDFAMYWRDIIQIYMKKSPIFLELLSHTTILKTLTVTPIKCITDIVKEPRYKEEEYAIQALTQAVSMDMAKSEAKPFIDSLLNSYLKNQLRRKARANVFELFCLLRENQRLDEPSTLRILFSDSLVSKPGPELEMLVKSIKQETWKSLLETDGSAWNDFSFLAVMKIFRVLVNIGWIEIVPALNHFLEIVDLEALERSKFSFSDLGSDSWRTSCAVKLVCAWIENGKPISQFPSKLFSLSLDDLISHPRVFSMIVFRTNSVSFKYDIKILSYSFPNLIAAALFHYFCDDHTKTDHILSSLLKRNLGDKIFEIKFRDQVLEIVYNVIQLCAKYEKLPLIEQCLGHIGSLFKLDSSADIYKPGYLLQILIMAIEDFDYIDDSHLHLVNFITQKCPKLLSDNFVSKIIQHLASKMISRSPMPLFMVQLQFLLSLVRSSARIFGRNLAAFVLGKVHDYEHLRSFWIEGLTSTDLKDVLQSIVNFMDLSSKILNVEDELLLEFMKPLNDSSLCRLADQLACANAASFPQCFKYLQSRSLPLSNLAICHVSYILGRSEELTQDEVLSITGNPFHELFIQLYHLIFSSPNLLNVLASIMQLANSELCTPEFWNSLPSELRHDLNCLYMPDYDKRLLLPKSRDNSSPPYEQLWSTMIDLGAEEWQGLLAKSLLNMTTNPLWAKISLLFDGHADLTNVVVLMLEDCFWSQDNSKSMLDPIRVFLNICEPRNDKFRFMIAVKFFESLLGRRNQKVDLDIDFKKLGRNLLGLSEDPLRAIYFFELGLKENLGVQEDDAETLEQLYSRADLSDYSGCFSTGTKYQGIAGTLSSLLKGPQNGELAQYHKEALWRLQEWNLATIPDEDLCNRPGLEIYNIFRLLADQDGVKNLNCYLNSMDLTNADDSLCKLLLSSYRYLETGSLSVMDGKDSNFDIVLTCMESPFDPSKVALKFCKVLEKHRQESNHHDIAEAFEIVERYHSIKDLPDLNFVLQGEKAKFLWSKGYQEDAIELLRLSLSSIPAIPIQDVFLREYMAVSCSVLGEWIFDCKYEKPSAIKQQYLDKSLRIIGNNPSTPQTLSKIYSTYAKFVDHMFEQMIRSENLEQKGKLLHDMKADVEALTKLAMRNRDETVLRSLKSLEQQYAVDQKEYEEIEKSRASFLLLAVENFLRCLQLDDRNDLCIFRICSLWLQYYLKVPDLSRLIASGLGKVPCHKFLPLIYQLAARAEHSEVRTPELACFQETLEKLLFRMASKHPFHCVYQILALKFGLMIASKSAPSKRKLVFSTESLEVRRAAAAGSLITKLKGSEERVGKIVSAIEKLCEAYIEIADTQLPVDTKPNVMIKFDPKWTIRKVTSQIAEIVAIPTKSINVDPSGIYADVPTVVSFGDGFKVVGGINLPKIIDCLGSDGQLYRQLVKGKDDVRQDAVMEQVFSLVDSLLKSNESTKKRGLGIRTYRIIPLHALAGLLEWVKDTIPLGEYVLPAHERLNPGDMSVKAARTAMKAAFETPDSTPLHKLRVFNGICQKFRPVLRHFFWETASNPLDWWSRRSRYVTSCAASSMLGHVVGLGDRHCQNILLDKVSGDMIQIDLNMIFEMGKSLRIPERVPFRLTRDIVDGMGPAGTKGAFSKASEETLKLLRSQAETIMMILEVFKYDPLYRWTISPHKLARKTLEDHKEIIAGALPVRLDKVNNSEEGAPLMTDRAPPEADRALLRIKEKLLGFEEGGSQLSEAGQVRFLIQEASNPEALSQMYIGWQPWV